MENIKMKMSEESQVSGLDPKNTSTALLERWTLEYFNDLINEGGKVNEEDEAIDLLLSEDDKLRYLVEIADKEGIEDYLLENPDLVKSYLKGFSEQQERKAERLRKKAIRVIYDDEDIAEAIKIINEGIDLGDIDSLPELYTLRALCHSKDLNYEGALDDLNTSINLLLDYFPNDYEYISECFKERAELKRITGDLEGATHDELLSAEYIKKQTDQAVSDEEDEIPF